MTGATSIVPGMSMLFVMAQTVQRGARHGAAALAGMQIGYLVWWALAALGLGSLAAGFPKVFAGLAIAGAAYLAWLGVESLRHAGGPHRDATATRQPVARRAFRSGVAVAIGNPKSLVYMVAMLPPFIDPGGPIVPQIVVLALVAMVIDVAVGALYIATGSRLSMAMREPSNRRRVEIVIGAIYLAIAAGLLIDLAIG